MRYILLIAYDGLTYHGWQIQKHCRTIAGTIRAAFKESFHVDVRLVGASRTDTGVHALGQIALVEMPLAIECSVLKKTINGRLPNNIVVRRVGVAPEDFHPLRGVTSKTYFYHFFCEQPLPFIARYGTWFKHPLSIEHIRKGLTIFKGTHDFRSFCTDPQVDSTVRTIDEIRVDYLKWIRTYRIIVQGKGFLHHMIRRILGAVFYAALYDKDHDVLVRALEERNPYQKLPIAKAHGLLLRRIRYERLLW